MWFPIAFLAAATGLIVSVVNAQSTTSAENFWQFPDGIKPDLSLTVRNGESVNVSWIGWDSSNFIRGTNRNVNLYVVAWSGVPESDYNAVLKRNIDLRVPGSFDWTVDIPTEELDQTLKYQLSFLSAEIPRYYYGGSVSLNSPGFIVGPQRGGVAADAC